MTTLYPYQTDHDFVRAIKKGDENCIFYLYRVHGNILINFVLRNNGTIDDAHEIAHETVIAFYEKAQNPTFKLTCSLNSFLYSIAKNLWLKELRRKGKAPFVVDTISDYINIKDEDYDEENDKLIAEIMKIFVNKMGDSCQKVLTLFYWNHYKFEQIAQMLGYTNADSAKQQKAKCLKQLRDKCQIIKNNKF